MRILYFSTVNWNWIKQRPHYMASYLAQMGYQIDYLSLTPFGKSKITRKNLDRLHINDLYTVPFTNKFKFIDYINRNHVRNKFKNKSYEVIILTSPLQYLYLPKDLLQKSIIIYECMDNMPYFFEGTMRARMLLEEENTLKLVDGIITSSVRLKEEISYRLNSIGRNIPITHIFNALDKETIMAIPNKVLLKEPNMVYIGTIAKWFDWEVIRRFARQNPSYTIYLIGPVEGRIRGALEENIVLTGPIEHKKIVGYIYSGNIMLLPFKLNELTEAVDPVKMYEYLALKKPVISRYWPELDKFKNTNTYFYENYDQFETHVKNLLSSPSENDVELNIDFIENHNWQIRANQYIKFIKEILNNKQ